MFETYKRRVTLAHSYILIGGTALFLLVFHVVRAAPPENASPTVQLSGLELDLSSLPPGGSQATVGTGGIIFRVAPGKEVKIQQRGSSGLSDGTSVMDEHVVLRMTPLGNTFPMQADVKYTRNGVRVKAVEINGRISLQSANSSTALRSKDGNTILVIDIRAMGGK